MQPRKELLKELATINDWSDASRTFFEGESWFESRNTVYRFRDGVCFDVVSRDPRKSARAPFLARKGLVGMRLVGWLSEKGFVFADDWRAGACAVLWRSGGAEGEEAMAMTSATTAFAHGRSSAHFQALHDHLPPAVSQTFKRDGGSAPSTARSTPEAESAPSTARSTPEAESAPSAETRPGVPSSSYRSG